MTESCDFIKHSYKADLGSGTCFALFNRKDFLFVPVSETFRVGADLLATVCCVRLCDCEKCRDVWHTFLSGLIMTVNEVTRYFI